jgi:FK506-binding nuclear protein
LDLFLDADVEIEFSNKGQADVYLTGEAVPEPEGDWEEISEGEEESSFSAEELKKLPRDKPTAAASAAASKAQSAPAKPKAASAKAPTKAAAKPSPTKPAAAKPKAGEQKKPAETNKRPREETPADGAKKGKPAAPQTPQVQVKQGVQVLDVKTGTGAVAKRGARVKVRYVGSLKNGHVFDKGDIGFKLGAGEVIKGWDIGVEGMKVEGERKLMIPANLAYGKQRAGEIPPNSDLNLLSSF